MNRRLQYVSTNSPIQYTGSSHKIDEELPHLADEQLVIFPAFGKFLQHWRLALLGLNGRQYLLFEIALVYVAIPVVQLVCVVIWCLLRAHRIAVPVGSKLHQINRCTVGRTDLKGSSS